jgi:hypothetical protein
MFSIKILGMVKSIREVRLTLWLRLLSLDWCKLPIGSELPPCFGESASKTYQSNFDHARSSLFFAKKRQAQNLYYLTEKMELTESARYYYLPNDAQSLTMKEIVSLGISEEELWKLWQSNTPPEITT